MVFPPNGASGIVAASSQHEVNQAGLHTALRDKNPSFGKAIFEQN